MPARKGVTPQDTGYKPKNPVPSTLLKRKPGGLYGKMAEIKAETALFPKEKGARRRLSIREAFHPIQFLASVSSGNGSEKRCQTYMSVMVPAAKPNTLESHMPAMRSVFDPYGR